MLLQSEASTLDDRISKSRGVRNAGGISLGGCQPNRVQASWMHSALNGIRLRLIGNMASKILRHTRKNMDTAGFLLVGNFRTAMLWVTGSPSNVRKRRV